MLAACSSDGGGDGGPTGGPPPIHVTASAALSQQNPLVAVVTATVENADSARVMSVSTSGTRTALTPRFAASGAVQIPVVGLKSLTPYSLVVEASTSGNVAYSATVTVTTGDLPQLLKDVHMRTVKGTSTGGYTLTAINFPSSVIALAFDSAGSIVWYKDFPGSTFSLAFTQQSTHTYTIYVGDSHGWEPAEGKYVEFSPAGDVVREWKAPQGFYLDGHDIALSGDAASPVASMLTYTVRTVDARSIGGSATEQLAQHAIHRVTTAGAAELVADAWNIFTLPDWIEPTRLPPSDVDHPNSLAIAPDGNYLVSWRNTGEISKINRTNGSLIWRLGGAHNQFQISGDPFNGFSAQHDAGFTSAGTLLLYDNGSRHEPSQSRAVEYRLDETAKTATMVREFRHDPAIYTAFVGSAQRLDNGNTLVGWALNGLATEYSATGTAIWEGQMEFAGANLTTYRIQRTKSLYGR
jgi:hypothetical protein